MWWLVSHQGKSVLGITDESGVPLPLSFGCSWESRQSGLVPVSVSKIASMGRSQTCCWPHHWAPWAASERARHFRVGDTQRAAVDLEGALVVEVGLLVALGAFSSNIGEFGWKYVAREQKGLLHLLLSSLLFWSLLEEWPKIGTKMGKKRKRSILGCPQLPFHAGKPKVNAIAPLRWRMGCVPLRRHSQQLLSGSWPSWSDFSAELYFSNPVPWWSKILF